MNSFPIIFLYESRVLLREGLTAQLQQAGHQVVACLSMEQLTEEICQQTERPKILLVGAGGLGDKLFNVLRTLHFTQRLSLKTLVYLPGSDDMLSRVFMGAGACQCLTEEKLGNEILPLLQDPIVKYCRGQRFSPSELNILIDFASGLHTPEIAARRNCHPKTVYTFKLNIRTRLEIDTKNGWFDLLSRIAQLRSLYE